MGRGSGKRPEVLWDLRKTWAQRLEWETRNLARLSAAHGAGGITTHDLVEACGVAVRETVLAFVNVALLGKKQHGEFLDVLAKRQGALESRIGELSRTIDVGTHIKAAYDRFQWKDDEATCCNKTLSLMVRGSGEGHDWIVCLGPDRMLSWGKTRSRETAVEFAEIVGTACARLYRFLTPTGSTTSSYDDPALRSEAVKWNPCGYLEVARILDHQIELWVGPADKLIVRASERFAKVASIPSPMAWEVRFFNPSESSMNIRFSDSLAAGEASSIQIAKSLALVAGVECARVRKLLPLPQQKKGEK